MRTLSTPGVFREGAQMAFGAVVQHESFEHRSLFIPSYVKIKARRVGKLGDEPKLVMLWAPG
ncbi:MAG: hypothetical protein HY043_12685 [Verrucomicrobia bacterium]|nr:hypothetical protein [Verrucomicrobiota bacterium]